MDALSTTARHLELDAPDWAPDAILYHIFPLGFLNAEPRNDRESESNPRLSVLSRWYEHIQNMGANTILFGPLFESQTHGYDTVDYRSIDRRLGDMDTFKKVVRELQQRGFRVLLDVAFNHTGRNFFAFQDIRQRGSASKYADWYFIDPDGDSPARDGFAYHCWHGHHQLPSLNLENPDVRAYIFETTRFYLEDVGIDGWRLDAAEDIAPTFWRDFRTFCKKIKPDCLLLGEIVYGNYHRYLGADRLDAATHYPLYEAICRSFNQRRTALLARQLRNDQRQYGQRGLMSFLGNHDVTRIITRLRQDAHFYPAMILLLGLPYTPCLYYGDECGMEGDKEDGDHTLRRPMPPPEGPWVDPAGDRYREIARLAALRQEHAVLRRGTVTGVWSQHRKLAVRMQYRDETAMIVINIGRQTEEWAIPRSRLRFDEGMSMRDVLNPELPPVTVGPDALELEPLYPCWGRILIHQP